MADYGFGAVNKNLNTKNDNNLKNSLGFTISTGRVVSIILDGDDYLSIGNIEYVNIESTPKDISTINPNANRSIAKPLLPNIKNYPLINELVLILRLPDIGIKASTASKLLFPVLIKSSTITTFCPFCKKPFLLFRRKDLKIKLINIKLMIIFFSNQT